MVSLITSFIFPVSTSYSEKSNQNSKVQNEENEKSLAIQEEVTSLLQELSEIRASRLHEVEEEGFQNLAYSESNLDLKEINQSGHQNLLEEIKIERKLKQLGVIELSNSEIVKIHNSLMVEEELSPFVVTPPSTSRVRWYSHRHNYNYLGQAYEVQQLYAQGLSSSSNLTGGQGGVQLYSNLEIITSNISELASIYTQKAIGLVPLVGWLPYELIGSKKSVSTSHNFTYNYVTTVCFSYVKLSGQSDNSQVLSYVSNFLTVKSTHIFSGIKDGKLWDNTETLDNTSYASSYASLLSAVNSYRNTSAPATSSFVSRITFYNHDKSRSHSVNVYTPVNPTWVN